MKSRFTLHYIAILLLTFVCAYGQNVNASIDECKNNFTPSCLALLEQAKKNKDEENIKFYRA